MKEPETQLEKQKIAVSRLKAPKLLKTESVPVIQPVTSVESLVRSSGRRMSPRFKRLMKERIRSVKDLGRWNPEDPDDQVMLATLRHQAELDALGANAAVRTVLKQYDLDSAKKIAEAPRSEVVKKLTGKLSDIKAAELYVKASAKYALDVTETVGEAIEKAAFGNDGRCGCKDCESAVSPAAYLADLMDYCLKHVRIAGGTITIAQLEKTFFHPYSKLPLDCAAVDERIRQVRLAVEIFRGYLAASPPNTIKAAALAAEGKRYRTLAYNVLLIQIGTSYDEVRSARTASAPVRSALADRLGISLGPIRPDFLDQLFFDADADAPDPTAVTESALEKLFGLVDTTRDPFLPGTIPQWLAWRTAHLRSVWLALDRPKEDVLRRFEVLIDPDLINPGDFVNPVTTDPAFALWTARDAWVKAELTALQAEPKTLAGLDTRVQSVLSVGSTPLVTLGQRDANGEEIDADLTAVGLRRAELLAILKFRSVLNQGLPALDSEWADLENLLVQIRKRSQYVVWRAEESSAAIVLAPDTFKVPKEGAPEPELLAWRASLDDRWKLQDTLKSRIAQLVLAESALKEALAAAESAGLPLLRDALVEATDAIGDTEEERQRWASRRFLIDASAGACQITTRIALAMETLQNLLFSLFNGAFKMGPVQLQSWELVAERFEDEWQWIGSYASWRSAMLVFLYPQNVMMPSLKRPMSGAFRQLIADLRSKSRLSASQVCAAAQAYADYFHDICTLNIDAACQTHTRVHRPTKGCVDASAPLYRSMFYSFGVNRGHAYWCVYDPEGGGDFTQSFWEPIPNIRNASQIIGAVAHGEYNVARHIYVFVKTWDAAAGPSLVLTRYNLETRQWTGEAWVLELPEQARDFVAVAKQSEAERMAPHLALQFGDNIYERKLKWNGVAWEDGFWTPIQKYPNGPRETLWQRPFEFAGLRQLHAMVAQGGGDGVFLVMSDWQGQVWGLYYHPGYIGSKPDQTIPKVMLWHNFEIAQFVGASFWTNSFQMIIWFVGARYYCWVENHAVWDFQHAGVGNTDVRLVAPLSGNDPESYKTKARLFAYRGGANSYRCRFQRQSNHFLKEEHRAPVRPQVNGPFLITNGITTADLQARATQIQAAFTTNLPGGSSIVAYLEEAYYLVPTQLGVLLMQVGDYARALDWFRTVYDYTQSEKQRPIYYGLILEQKRPESWSRSSDWLLDPLNPHLIGATRKLTNTRYILQTIIKCLLDYADSEFTRDSPESLERARTLYLMVLKLLESDALFQNLTPCDDLIGRFDIEVTSGWEGPKYDLYDDLAKVRDRTKMLETATALKKTLQGRGPIDQRFAQARAVVDAALTERARPVLTDALRQQNEQPPSFPSRATAAILDRSVVAFRSAVASVTGLAPDTLDKADLSFLREMPRTLEQRSDTTVSMPFPPPPPASGSPVWTYDPKRIAEQIGLTLPYRPSVPRVLYYFCIPPNPVLRSLRMRAEVNLYKLRTCRNIAGSIRQIDVYSAPTDVSSLMPTITGGRLILPSAQRLRPTPYKYGLLVERAKQMTQLAAQVEASMLATLEKRDAEAYNMMKAQQDMDFAQAQVRLQDLRLKQAKDGVRLAQLQREQAEIRANTYNEWLTEGLSDSEQRALKALGQAVDLSNMSSYYLMGAAAAHGMQSGVLAVATAGLGGFGELGASLSAMASSLSSRAQAKSTESSRLSLQASYERRQNDWTLQRNLAQQDVRIGRQQEVLAEDGVQVATQERVIATLQTDHAADVIQFLSNKFTNVDLYDWMSGVLEGVYSYFLQQSTATALLAYAQLAFERQELPPSYIQSDYWIMPEDTGAASSNGSSTADRKGLTGSARLLQDVFRLDQYAFDTGKRRLQLTKTISLAQLAPLEFQQFREKGVMPFALTSQLFDRDFPGHYLRLIKRVRASVIALVPPNQGLRAELFHSGFSHVVTKADTFMETPVRRDPEVMAFTAPLNATGVFEPDPQPEMLAPFEGLGVAGQWQVTLPKAANFFDYSTIADVLITIDYTALHDSLYREQILQRLPRRISVERPLSFRHHLADAWYDLHNPDQTATPMTISFETRRQDFPANLEDLQVENVALFFSRAAGILDEVSVNHFRFVPDGLATAVGGTGSSIAGVVSTRRSNGSNWLGMLHQRPLGRWELSLPNNLATRALFQKQQIEDILVVITYTARTAPWPA